MKSTFTLPGSRALLLAAMLAVPGLAAAQQAPLTQALSALTTKASRQGLSEQDLANPAVTSHYTDASTGLTHVYLRQRHQGIEIHNAVANVHVGANGRVVTMHHNFVAGVAARVRSTTPALTATQAVAAAARALSMPAPRALSVEQEGTPAAGMVFNEGGISLEKIPVKLVYQRMAGGELALAWDVTLAPLDAQHHWNVRVDAQSGQLLEKYDYTISEPVSFAELTQKALATRGWQQVLATPAPTTANRTTAPNSYNVFPATIESPSHGARQLLVNPASSTFSPFGWHDVNGVAGADSTNTKGNNVFAYLDRDGTNIFRKGASPEGGATQIFDFPFTTTAQPEVNKDAAVTNLFYWNNVVHDVMATKGFTEAAGNFQRRNYTTVGGTALPGGNDQVLAEAQDGAAKTAPNLNNANFSTPPDGSAPRMQMFEWSGVTSVTVTAPASVAGPLNAVEGAQGRSLSVVGPITGTLVPVNDGSAQPMRGCNVPFVNAAAINGNIAFIRRGSCNFSAKIKNAQNAGARLVVVMDSIVGSTALVTMAGTAPDSIGIRIPSLFINYVDGTRLLAAITAGQTVTLTAGTTPRRDGDFDNGIITHEYGHGISTRLTGGRLNSSCLPNTSGYETMGEGWSDFFGLWMTTKPGDVGTTPRGIGTYASSEPVAGDGIRTQRYSTDMLISDLTYDNLGTSGYTETHAVGEIWCTALWDMNWAMIARHGYNADFSALTGGNNMALRLVLEGMKLQPCTPGMLDGRNAILKADSILYGASNSDIIWRAFARRGMGFDAIQGLATNVTDNTAGFALPSTLSTSKRLNEQLLEVYPNPAREQVVVRTQVSSKSAVAVEMLTLMGQVVRSTSVSAATLQQAGVKLNTAELANGVYVVRITTSEGTITKKVAVQH
ncbi:T9SS-dependent M36 family metallopeptidase [Hymenobacter psychrotolerans]|uniref:Por secretion system C-terminal sorting domain-containing protein n=1 Tax=Hymenobacter psychrotolerans DSM 18569 TaxID=1121959 RepID=A0A1M6Z4E2_9BACT|nr:T9SS-dependent M36 family metallopeptidase [Hymenobacter psychrotolerans]SHL25388.1 Por secretion system C-terminal sorting domain-containing protein [Hymenobacter psychrotolerans DSM 18569]